MNRQIELTPAGRRQVADLVCQKIELNLEAPEFVEALTAEHREQIDTGGVRAGKSTAGAAKIEVDAQIKILLGQPGLYWIIGPDYNQAHQEIEYLYKWALKTGDYVSHSFPTDGPRSLELTRGIRIETKSAMYHERLGSVAPDGILVVEAGQCSDEIRRICQERSMEKSCWILYTGTLENEFDKPQYAWFTELAAEWEEDRTGAHGSYRLPSWINRTIYGSCTQSIKADPSLLEYCPDDNHGTAHSGFLHPEIQRAKDKLPEYIFSIRIAGAPAGLPFVVYPQLDEEQRYLRPFDGSPKISAAGGIDFGTVHPTAIAVVTFHQRPGPNLAGEPYNIAWVRDIAFNKDDPGDVSWLRRHKDRLAREYKIPAQRFGVDPNERFMARSFAGEAVSGSSGAREYRIGLITARLNADALFFDSSNEAVRAAYAEMKLVRRIKQRNGEMVLRRLEDDRAAAIEDAIEMEDGRQRRPLPINPMKRRYPRRVRRRELQRV